VQELFQSLAQVAIAAVLSGITAYLAFYLFQWFTRDLDEWEALRQGNAAVGLVLGSLIVAVALILRPALSVNTTAWDIGPGVFFQVLLAEGLQVLIALVLALLAVALAFVLFAGLTRGLDEMAELKKGNLAIAALLSGVFVGVGIMVSMAVAQVTQLVASLLFG
jgi:uncharacterized membrane protein YjfL (UPF0719 family)